MVPALRQRHRQIWLALAFILPVAYITAILTLRPPVGVGQLPFEEPAPVAAGPAEENFRVAVRAGTSDGERLIEVTVLRPLTVPAAVVSVERSGRIPQVLGQLGPVGVYQFTLDSASTLSAVTIVDPLKNTTLLTTQIQ